jgi:hypothetical protein
VLFFLCNWHGDEPDGGSKMKWTMHELGLIAPLSWFECLLVVCVFFILVVAGMGVIKFANYAYKVMRGE